MQAYLGLLDTLSNAYSSAFETPSTLVCLVFILNLSIIINENACQLEIRPMQVLVAYDN